MNPRTSLLHIQIADELDAFVDHNVTLLRWAIAAGIAAAFTPQPGIASTVVCLSVFVYIIAAWSFIWPTLLDDLRRRGQGKLAEDARQSWLGTAANQRMALLCGLAVTAGMWREAIQGLWRAHGG